MATKSNRSKDNITKNIFIKTLLFCILLSLCLYQIIYFLASDYDKERFAKENGPPTTEQADSDKQNAQSKTNQNKAVTQGDMFNFQSSIIDYNALYSYQSSLQPSQTAKAKEHTQNISGKIALLLHLQKRKSKSLLMMPYINKMHQVKQMMHKMIQN